MIKPLGLSAKRATALKKMSFDYVAKEWEEDPTVLYGIGKYGADAYRIFCTTKWKDVSPKDSALVNYHRWLKIKSV